MIMLVVTKIEDLSICWLWSISNFKTNRPADTRTFAFQALSIFLRCKFIGISRRRSWTITWLLRKSCTRKKAKIRVYVPVIAKDRVIDDNFLKQLYKLIWQVSRHKCFNCYGNVFWILSFGQGRLHNLIDQRSAILVLVVKDFGP